jgi:hypothetical protein
MFLKLRRTSAIALLVLPVYAIAGERVEGNGPNKEAAASAAENRANRQAAVKNTCITPVKLSECRKERDGTWTCFAAVANHRGSCGR